MAKFKRILLKLSGESLMGKQSFGIDPERLSDYAKQIKEVHEMGVQIGIVIGGGNIFRGLSGSQKGFDRVKGDQMGMCATVINSLALSSALGALGVKNKVLTAIRMEPIGEFYTKWKAIEAMEEGYICIFSAGTGSPYFTTDTGSSLRGIEIEADVMLKGTRVDGLCDRIKLAPFINGHARRAVLTIVNHSGPLVKTTLACNQCCLRFHRLPPSVAKV